MLMHASQNMGTSIITIAFLASAPLHTQDTEIWFGCPGVTAATELLNIR